MDWSPLDHGGPKSGARRVSNCADVSQTAARIVRETGTDVKKPPTVFIVDDRSRVVRSLEATIKKHGFPVQCYTCAEDFIAEQDADQVGCVLVDPLRATDGSVVLRWLHDSGSQLAIALISGLINAQDFTAQDNPSSPILGEPYEISTLLTMVTDGLSGSLSRNVIRERSRG
jgi:FixJ family two-component response regulator